MDNDGPYSPSNCRWVTNEFQQSNKRNNRLIEHNGEENTLAEWARKTGMNEATLAQRLRAGWTIERALTEPVKKIRKRVTQDE